MTPAPSKPDGDGPLARQQSAVTMFKKVGLAVLGLALQTYGAKLSEQQEVLSFTADILIDTFATESAVQRALQATDAGERSAALQADAARALANDAAMRIEGAARSALAAMAEGDTLRTHLAALRRLLKVTPVNVVAIRRRLADETVERAGYIF